MHQQAKAVAKRKARPIRVLHVLGALVQGGTETWLMNVLRHVDRQRFQLDFMVQTTHPCVYDNEVRALGGNIILCLNPGTHPAGLLSHGKRFRDLVAAYGPYDVVHCHMGHFNGWICRMAHYAGVPVRIAHSHNSPEPKNISASMSRRIYLATTRHWIHRYATIGLAPSAKAAQALFGLDWKKESRFRIFWFGVDFAPFHAAPEPRMRDGLGLPEDAFIIGHVGRIEEQKNHRFLMEIARKVKDKEPKTRVLIIGEGSLRPGIEQLVRELGLAGDVVFAGTRSDVPGLLVNAMDVFVLPSFHEGLCLAGLEAQAAGLPCVFADTVPAEADAVPGLVRRLSLSQSAEEWAEAVLATRRPDRMEARGEALEILDRSAFSVRTSVSELERLYSDSLDDAD